MCLWIKDRELRVATKDIPVLKRLSLFRKDWYRIESCTPVQGMYTGTLSELKGKEIEPIKPYDLDKLKVDIENPDNNTLRGGLIHAHTEFRAVPIPGDVVFEAVIPKGAHYVVGAYHDIAAERIIIKKIPWWNIIKQLIKRQI